MNPFLSTLGLVAAMATTEDVRPALETCISTEARKLEFSGVVSVVQPAGVVLHAGGLVAGPASPSIGPDTRFNLASVGKMFTAVAAAQLVDSGKVRLDDPIGRHVKGLTPEASAVTVRQLLDHSSGLGNFMRPENEETLRGARSVANLLPFIVSARPAFPPGSRFEYSNSGFLLLGLLVERVSGVSYGRYLDEHVFGPAGMVATGLDPGVGAKPAVATTRDGAAPVIRGTPAGGAFGTAGDVQRFFAALLAGRLTSRAMLQELTTAQIQVRPEKGDGPALAYGLGFGVGASRDTGGSVTTVGRRARTWRPWRFPMIGAPSWSFPIAIRRPRPCSSGRCVTLCSTPTAGSSALRALERSRAGRGAAGQAPPSEEAAPPRIRFARGPRRVGCPGVLLHLSSDLRRAMDLSLVLEQEGIPHELRRVEDAHWVLQVDDNDAMRAEAAIAAFEQENPPEVRRPEGVLHPMTGAVASGVGVLACAAGDVRPDGSGIRRFALVRAGERGRRGNPPR